MDYIDRKYILLSSNYLDKFSQVKSDLFRCRCPYCLDSKKNPNKTRGFFYFHDNKSLYKCHNCQVNKTLYHFLLDFHAETLCKEYKIEKFKSTNPYYSEKKDVEEFKYKKSETQLKLEKKFNTILSKLIPIKNNEEAYQYMLNRKIPIDRINELYYVDNINIIRENIEQYKEFKKLPDVSAIVIPFYNKDNVLTHVQCRMLNTGDSFRYLTFEIITGTEKIYGMNKIDVNKEVFIFEGAFDAMCVNNAIAVAGASLLAAKSFYDENLDSYTFVYDSDYVKNSDVHKQVEKTILAGCKVVLFDDVFINNNVKDINDLVKNNIISNIEKYLIDNTYQGLKAKFLLGSKNFQKDSNTWQKTNQNSTSTMKNRLKIKQN